MTKFTLESYIKFYGAGLLSNMVIEIILELHGEIGTLVPMQRPSRTILLVTMRIKLCSMGSKIFKNNLFVAIGASMSVLGV